MNSHLTASGLILNEKNNLIPLVFHKKLSLWLTIGGHVEEGELIHEAALREAYKEVGLHIEIVDASPSLGVPYQQGASQTEYQLPAPKWVLHEYIAAIKKMADHIL